MSRDDRLQDQLDRQEIADVLFRWGYARDSDDWDGLAACFHEDATISISWIEGPAREFIARSREMAARRRPGSHMKHIVGAPLILTAGARAFARCHILLLSRATFDGLEVDLQSHFRFFDLLEKRDGAWRILKRTGVYEKDRLDLVDPRVSPDGLFDGVDLSAFQPELRFLSLYLTKAGRPVRRVPVVYSAEEEALRQEGLDWLADAAAG